MATANRRKRPSAAVYRRRRIVVLLALILVGLLLWWLVTLVIGLVSSDDDAPSESEPVVTDPTATPEPTTTGATPRNCEADEIAITAQPATDAVSLGGSLDINVTWQNVGEVACLINGGFGETSINITSGDDAIWSSTFCSSESLDLFLDAGDDYARTYEWGLERADAGCENRTDVSSGGTYRVTAEVLGAASDEVVFVIEG